MLRKALYFTYTVLMLLVAGTAPTLAAPPSLSEYPDAPLPNVFQTSKTYTLRLRYADQEGDRPIKAQFIDESAAGSNALDRKSIDGTDYRNGVPIVWEIRGFEQGAHRGYFLVTSTDGQSARYPPAPDQFYTFVVESLVTKWIIMGVGLLVGLLFVPFLVYVLARSLNRRGDPSRAARVGLLIGILACCALFLYLFLTFYSPLVLAIGVVAGLALLIVVVTRR